MKREKQSNFHNTFEYVSKFLLIFDSMRQMILPYPHIAAIVCVFLLLLLLLVRLKRNNEEELKMNEEWLIVQIIGQ